MVDSNLAKFLPWSLDPLWNHFRPFIFYYNCLMQSILLFKASSGMICDSLSFKLIHSWLFCPYDFFLVWNSPNHIAGLGSQISSTSMQPLNIFKDLRTSFLSRLPSWLIGFAIAVTKQVDPHRAQPVGALKKPQR